MSLAYYTTRKQYPDGSEEIRIKRGIDPLTLEKRLAKARAEKERFRQVREDARRHLIERYNNLRFTDEDYDRTRRMIECELNLRNFANVRRSAGRARQCLYDICRCNHFMYFVTLTLDPGKVNRNNDAAVRRKFSCWANNMKKKYPDMFYVATPEYHKKGALHFHLLVGGITMEVLKCTLAVKKNGRLKRKHGFQIYNVGAWKNGWAELSVLGNEEAAKHYICKYITKQNLDDRFFGKRRYYCSYNIRRPVITKSTYSYYGWEMPDLNVYSVSYCDDKKGFAVFKRDGDGVVKEHPTSAAVRAIVEKALCERICADAGVHPRPRVAARRAATSVPNLTIGTLESNSMSLSAEELEFRYKTNSMMEKLKKEYRQNTENYIIRSARAYEAEKIAVNETLAGALGLYFPTGFVTYKKKEIKFK